MKNNNTQRERKSKLQVLKSNAGYYIGRTLEFSGEPYSRESGYYPSKERAQQALDYNDYFRM